eukprot:1837909-Prorocentrum_lima.AAC.1
MTSSLVGSEMCIRDSLFVVQSAAFAAPLARLPLGFEQQRAPANSQPSSCCLLYTSDAADDM